MANLDSEHSSDDVYVDLIKARTSLASSRSQGAPLSTSQKEGWLTVDVFQTDSDIVIQSAIAGVTKDDLEINLTNNSVTIRGKRMQSENIDDQDYFYQECFWGPFSRSVVLPQDIDPEESTATFKNGVMTIRMPKLSKRRGKKVKVALD